MVEEPLSSYREAVRSRLQELMLTENYPPGHPLVSATARHLEMSTAEEAARRFSAPGLDHFYRGCDLYYSVLVRPDSQPSPQPALHDGPQQLPVLSEPLASTKPLHVFVQP